MANTCQVLWGVSSGVRCGARFGARFGFRLRAAAAAAALGMLAASPVQALGTVEAVVAGASDLQSGPTALLASASAGGLSASTSRLDSITNAAVLSNYPPSLQASTSTRSDFTVVGLPDVTALTFQWAFSASRVWNPDNTVFSAGMSVGVTAPGFIDSVGWGISYVDYAPAFGDFAGTLTAPFGVSAAGSGFANSLPAGLWDGQGQRTVGITMAWAQSGVSGNFGADISTGNAGELTAQHRIEFKGLTVPAGTVVSAGGAWLTLDNGQQIPITVVPEPQTWVLLLAGLMLVAPRLRRRS